MKQRRILHRHKWKQEHTTNKTNNNNKYNTRTTRKTTPRTITLLRVIPTMTCRVVVVRWGVVRVNWKCYFPNSWQRTMKKPLTLVFWTFACSCCVLPALQYSTWHKSCKIMSKTKTKHAKSCQDTTWQAYINKQASNMAVYLLKQSQKLVTATSDAQITNACSAPLEAFYAPNMPNHVRIPPVKQI